MHVICQVTFITSPYDALCLWGTVASFAHKLKVTKSLLSVSHEFLGSNLPLTSNVCEEEDWDWYGLQRKLGDKMRRGLKTFFSFVFHPVTPKFCVKPAIVPCRDFASFIYGIGQLAKRYNVKKKSLERVIHTIIYWAIFEITLSWVLKVSFSACAVIRKLDTVLA